MTKPIRLNQQSIEEEGGRDESRLLDAAGYQIEADPSLSSKTRLERTVTDRPARNLVGCRRRAVPEGCAPNPGGR